MTVTQIEGVIGAASATMDNWNNFLGDLLAMVGPDGTKFDLSVAISNINPAITLDELGQKLSGTMALLQEFSEIRSALLIPDATLTDLVARAGIVRATVEKLLAEVNSFDAESMIVSLDAAGLIATTGAGEQFNLSPSLAELYTFLQSLLSSAQQIRGMAEISGKGGLALELSHMQAARTAQRNALADFRRLSKALEVRRKELEALVVSAREAAARVTDAESSANKELMNVAETKERADALIASANDSEDAAKKVKEAVDAYSKTFAGFQKDLDARNVMFEKGKADLEALLLDSEGKRDALLLDQTTRYNELSSSIKSKEIEIEQILKRSRAVLGEATVSGLSDSFAKEMTEAGRQIWWMQLLFFTSIVLLLFGATVVLDAFPGIHITKAAAPSSGDAISVAIYLLANFLRTLTFLLAPLLLLIYASQRYVELFKMKTHYTYKYTVAASLPGFKLEAPKYAEEITAAAFQELLFNPGALMSNSDDEEVKPPTFLQRILEPIVKRAMEKMGENKL